MKIVPASRRISALCAAAAFMGFAGWVSAQSNGNAPKPLNEAAFASEVKPFLNKNCVRCHNADNAIAGIRVDNLDTSLDDRQIRFWEGIRHRVKNGTMPPKGQPQPTAEERQKVVDWTQNALEIARLRPAPKNGMVRRLTVAQYRNTLRELLRIDDDMAEILPPDAVSKDGFLNNKETLHLNPLLIETYLEIAEDALNRALVDPKQKPSVQNFRMDFGAGINKAPLPEELVLGANSLLLDNKDFTVTQLTPAKPFEFEPFFMRTKYRFIEGYQGNDTVRGWRDFDSIYHSVFACLRGSRGYPKGLPYSSVPQGLLLRPAIPNDEIFQADGTYGPKANFKISLRELPDHGRFRVTVNAARYNDGLLLDPGAAPQPADRPGAITVNVAAKKQQTATIAKPGIYQVDVHAAKRNEVLATPDGTHLDEGLSGAWLMDGSTAPAHPGPKHLTGTLEGQARFVDSPFSESLLLARDNDFVTVPRHEELSVGTGEFTVAAWIHPRRLRKSGLVSMGGTDWTHGWYLDMPDNKGILRFESAGPDNQSNGSLAAPAGTIRANVWQHVAAVIRRGNNESRLYVNGYLVAAGKIGNANLDNPKMNLLLGRVMGQQTFRGELDEVRLYRRALGDAEIQALIQPGRAFAVAPPEKPRDVTLRLGDREFNGTLAQPAFVVVRLPAGAVPVEATLSGSRELDKVVLTPLALDHELSKRFAVFEKRAPRLGVHLGLRRDCGSTFARVGEIKTVSNTEPAKFVFEGAIRNYPSPDVEKDNVNYLAGIREIAVRSEYTDGRDMPRLLIKSIEFEGPYYEAWPPASHKNVFVESAKKSDEAAYAREVLRGFAARAYRRPVADAELGSLVAVYEKARQSGREFLPAMKDALAVVLTSPQFLFLIENSTTPKPEPLDDWELSSKLSYFLWNGPPDRATQKLARTGTLRAALDTEVERMIASPKFGNFIKEFAAQWLSLDKFQVLEPDRNRFPKLNRDVRVHLRDEPVAYLQHLIKNNLPVKNLIDSDFVLLNEAAASYYELGDRVESGFQFIPVKHNRRELGGVLTQAAIMAGLSDGRESNPVKRGAWLARKIVAEPPADPPPNVPALGEDNQGLSLRERIEKHRSQPGCQQCHMTIDPWGVAFEEFDAGGRLKAQPADARSKLPDGAEVAGINDLKRHLAQDRVDQVAFSVLKHLATYATGRTLTYNEINYLKQDGLQLKATGYRMKDMIRYVVHSRMFLEK